MGLTAATALVEIGGAPIEAADSQRRWTRRRGWRVEIDGGVGEASPLPGLSRETHEQVGRALATYLAGDRVELPPSARFAVDTALADSAARARGVSVAEILGAPAAARAAGSELGLAPGPACRCVKLKAGPASAWRQQRAAIEALLRRRPELRVRIDFNGSLAIGEARAIAAEIAAAGWPVDFIEDPTPITRLAELAPLPVAVAIDAPLYSVIAEPGGVERAAELARRGAATVAVIKPALVGGLPRALDIAAQLSNAGLVPIASHLLDGPIALAACAELACAIGGELAHGVGLHPGLASYAPATIDQHRPPGRGRSAGPSS